jgi:hypothetical protein
MGFTVLNQYKDKWVLSAAAKVIGGGTIDVEPVRLIALHESRKLAVVLQELVAAEHPIVAEPDWNDRRFRVGIRADAVGAKTWRAFVRNARAFKLEQSSNGLWLEEWPRSGGSFGANAAWRRVFPNGAFQEVADYLVTLVKTPSTPTPSST